MSTAKIPGVKTVRRTLADGSVKEYHFHRETKARLPDDPSSDAFKAALKRIDRDATVEEAASQKGTIRSLIRTYCGSPDWTDLAASTREIETYNLKAIEQEFGDMPLSFLDKRGARGEFLAWRDDLAEEHPRAADSKIKRLAKIFSFGIDRELITTHPLLRIKARYAVDRSEIVWSDEHLDQMRAVAKPEVLHILEIALHTGQRRGDIINLRWANFDGKAISLRQSKTGEFVFIPCTTDLLKVLEEIPRVKGQTHMLLSTGGRPWTKDSIRATWTRAFDAAKIDADLHFHDLRGTAVTRLAEAGCTIPEIATISGHTLSSVNKILETYLKRSHTLAHSAIAKIEAANQQRKTTGKRSAGSL